MNGHGPYRAHVRDFGSLPRALCMLPPKSASEQRIPAGGDRPSSFEYPPRPAPPRPRPPRTLPRRSPPRPPRAAPPRAPRAGASVVFLGSLVDSVFEGFVVFATGRDSSSSSEPKAANKFYTTASERILGVHAVREKKRGDFGPLKQRTCWAIAGKGQSSAGLSWASPPQRRQSRVKGKPAETQRGAVRKGAGARQRGGGLVMSGGLCGGGCARRAPGGRVIRQLFSGLTLFRCVWTALGSHSRDRR